MPAQNRTLLLGCAICLAFAAWSPPSSAAPEPATKAQAAKTRAPKTEARSASAKRAWLGTALAPLGQVDRKQKGVPRYGGVLVERVLRNSPASRTGILAGDVIMRLDDKYVYQPEEIIRRVETRPVGKTLKIDVIRNGGWLTASVKLTPRPESVPPVPAKTQAPAQPDPPARSGRTAPSPAAAARTGEPESAGASPAALSERLGALEREVRLLRQAILAQQKSCRR